MNTKLYRVNLFRVLTLGFIALFWIQDLNQANALTNPKSLRSNIKVRNVLNTLSVSPSVRIVKDPRNNVLYYLKLNGDIFQVNLTTSSSTQVYSSANHTLNKTQGMAIGPDGTLFLVGNEDTDGGLQTRAQIVKGVPNGTTGQRTWSILAQSASYPKSKTAYDHRFSGIVVDPTGQFIYVNSGSRTDHGEVQSSGGTFPNVREVGLTACIFKLSTNSTNLTLVNNRNTLRSKGFLFAEGIRNTFDMAFAPNGDLFGPENGPDRDMSEELNWLRPNRHYGFPWRIGGEDNPQQFPDYDPTTDRLLDPRFNAVKKGYFRNDPTFPPRPAKTLMEPIINLGSVADSFRDPLDGQVKDASNLGKTLATFTAHRSPLGLVFDTAGVLNPEFNKDGFMLSFSPGDPTGSSVIGPSKDRSQDLLHLKLTKIGNTQYKVRTSRLVQDFNNPIDAEIIDNKIYVLEFGGNSGIWEVTMPTN